MFDNKYFWADLLQNISDFIRSYEVGEDPVPNPIPDPDPVPYPFFDFYSGVAVAGLEFTPHVLQGVLDKHYTQNKVEDYQYLASKRFDHVRLPFQWERLVVNDVFQEDYWSYIMNNITWAEQNNLSIVLDCHNYGRYNGEILTSPIKLFSLWSEISKRLEGNNTVVAYDLMNEPHDQPDFIPIYQAVVDGLRDFGESRWLIVQRNNHANAHRPTDDMRLINDPLDRIVYSAHYYCDDNHSGFYGQAFKDVNYNKIEDELTPFLEWCRERNVPCYLGEIAVPDNDPRWLECLEKILFLCGSDIAWNYWAIGDWYQNKEGLTIKDGNERPQMSVLKNYVTKRN